MMTNAHVPSADTMILMMPMMTMIMMIMMMIETYDLSKQQLKELYQRENAQINCGSIPRGMGIGLWQMLLKL